MPNYNCDVWKNEYASRYRYRRSAPPEEARCRSCSIYFTTPRVHVGSLPEIRSHLYCRMCLAVLQARESVSTKSRGDDRYDQDHPALVPPLVLLGRRLLVLRLGLALRRLTHGSLFVP